MLRFCIHTAALLLFVVASLGTAQAQTVDVTMSPLALGGDSLMVTVHLGESGKALPKSVSSFEILLSQPDQVELASMSSDFTMTDHDGWTTALNKDRGWVGGFASSLNAFSEGGALFTVLLLTPESFEGQVLCLESVRLNSDDPEASIPERCITR